MDGSIDGRRAATTATRHAVVVPSVGHSATARPSVNPAAWPAVLSYSLRGHGGGGGGGAAAARVGQERRRGGVLARGADGGEALTGEHAATAHDRVVQAPDGGLQRRRHGLHGRRRAARPQGVRRCLGGEDRLPHVVLFVCLFVCGAAVVVAMKGERRERKREGGG